MTMKATVPAPTTPIPSSSPVADVPGSLDRAPLPGGRGSEVGTLTSAGQWVCTAVFAWLLCAASAAVGNFAAQPTPKSDPKEEFAKRRAKAKIAETKYDLAMWAYDYKYFKESRELLEEGIRLEPNHRACRWALGHYQYNGEWLTREQARDLGLVLCRGEWVTPEKYEQEKKASEETIAKVPESSGGQGGKPGTFIKHVEINGNKRRYQLTVPKSYNPDKPMPLILWLHGDGGKVDSYNRQMLPLLEKEGFIYVSPESRRWQVWKEGTEGRTFEYALTEDDQYVDLCVKETLKEYNVAMRRIYIGGQSKGAVYASKLGRQHGDVYAAIGMINGNVSSSYGVPSFRKAPVFIWFGSRDHVHWLLGMRIHILKEDGHPVEFVYKEGGGHGATVESLQKMWDYIKQFSLE